MWCKTYLARLRVALNYDDFGFGSRVFLEKQKTQFRVNAIVFGVYGVETSRPVFANGTSSVKVYILTDKNRNLGSDGDL